MEGWKNWEGRKVFIILKNKRQYQGVVKTVDITKHLTWITIIDKFDKMITFCLSEMELMQEEDK